MVAKTIYAILLIFVLLVVIVPLLLNFLGIPVGPGGGGLGSSGGGGGTGGITGAVLVRSSDGGQHWAAAEFSREGRSALPSGILDVAFHPVNADVVFAGTASSGLWRSDDAGAVWKKIDDAGRVLETGADVYKVAISATRPDVMYLAVAQGNRGRVLRSEDGGASFREIYAVTRDGWAVFDIYTPPGAPDTVMIATGEGRLMVSSDGGARWRIAHSVAQPITSLPVNPVFSGERYLITSLGVMAKSFDGGDTWTELGAPSDTGGGGGDGSSDGRIVHPFSTWQFTFSSAAPSFTFAIDPRNPLTLYFTRADTLFTSSDGGFSWRRVTTLITAQGMSLGGVGADPAHEGTIFITAGGDFYQSADRGASWSTTAVASGISLKKIFSHPRRPGIIFITTAR